MIDIYIKDFKIIKTALHSIIIIQRNYFHENINSEALSQLEAKKILNKPDGQTYNRTLVFIE